MRCTQQSIALSDFGAETIGRPLVVSEESAVATSAQATSELPCAKLKVTGSGQLLQVPKPTCRIGTDAGNDVVLGGDATVARFHAQISFNEEEYMIRDLGTADGTYLNGQRVTGDPVIYDGDHIKIGSFKFYFISDLEG